MKIKGTYPVLCCRDVAATSAFFVGHFGYQVAFEADWFVHLTRERDDGADQLGFVKFDHETVPPSHRLTAAGLLVSIEVADATELWRRLKDKVTVLLALRDEAFGQRHFIAEAPGGVMVDVIEVIEPSEAFKEQYVPSAVV